MVGSNGIEPSTSRLSGVRSNHLSYEPAIQMSENGYQKTVSGMSLGISHQSILFHLHFKVHLSVGRKLPSLNSYSVL